jgi:hypothetical protein
MVDPILRNLSLHPSLIPIEATDAAKSFQDTLPGSARNSNIALTMIVQFQTRDAAYNTMTQRLGSALDGRVALPAARSTIGDYLNTYKAMLTNWTIFQEAYCTDFPVAYANVRVRAADYRTQPGCRRVPRVIAMSQLEWI